MEPGMLDGAGASAEAIASVRALGERVTTQVARVMVGAGAAAAAELALVALLSGGHVLFEDVPGVGKTALARTLARTLDISFSRVQGTPDLLPSDVTGVSVYQPASGEFLFRPGPVFASLVLADEINRATPRTQAALLEAMAEGQVTVDGVTRLLPTPFLLVATQNPIELEGTFPLPEAQLDRFLLRLKLDYPTVEEERALLFRFQRADPLATLTPVARGEDIMRAQPTVRAVAVSAPVADYLLAVIRATRSLPTVSLGASPRAALALFRASQALAALRGRGYVAPDDVKELAVPVLAHRLLLTSQARLHEQDAAAILQQVLTTTPVPVEADGTRALS